MSADIGVHRRGSVAAASSSDGKFLKVILVGQDGKLLDSHGHFLTAGAEDLTVQGALLDAEGTVQLRSKWTEGSLNATAHKHSEIAASTLQIAGKDIFAFYYQREDGAIVCQTFGRQHPNVADNRTLIPPLVIQLQD